MELDALHLLKLSQPLLNIHIPIFNLTDATDISLALISLISNPLSDSALSVRQRGLWLETKLKPTQVYIPYKITKSILLLIILTYCLPICKINREISTPSLPQKQFLRISTALLQDSIINYL